MMIACTTGHGGVIEVTPFASAFASMLIEELPTFLLALGSIFPACRSDIGFGLTFFVLRLLLHMIFLIFAILVGVDHSVAVLYAFTMAMHINWFYVWMTKYGRKLLFKSDKKSK